jgi:peptidyl-prolyl cis-trans isomerase SurA
VDQAYSGNDFYEFEKDLEHKTRDELYSEFVDSMIIDYYKDHLDETNKDFARTYKEYEDGLLLFELLQKKVWEKSEKDTVGLINYFDSNRSKYNWGRRGQVVIASCTNLEKAQIVRRMLAEDKPLDTIKESLNEGATIHVLFSKGKLEEGSSKLPEGYVLETGVSEIYETEPFNFTIIKTDAIFEPERKELKETRGEVMNDYQNYLEQEWVSELHNIYTVRINHKNYKELKKRLSTE